MNAKKLINWPEVGSLFRDGMTVMYGGFMGVGTPAGIVPASDSGLVRRDARDLARGQPLFEHDAPCGAEERVAETGRVIGHALSVPLRATPSASPTMQRKINRIPENHFAQLDAHNLKRLALKAVSVARPIRSGVMEAAP